MSEITPAEWTAILLSLRVAVVATLVATPFGAAACGDDREDEPPPTLGGATVLEQTSTTETTAP